MRYEIKERAKHTMSLKGALDKKQGNNGNKPPIKQPHKVDKSNINHIGLCHRCEYRAQYKEIGHAPRFECGTDGNSSICYSYKPVKPVNLKYPEYNKQYDKVNKMRSPFGGYLSARMQADSVAEGEYTIVEKDGVYTTYFVPNSEDDESSE